MFWHRKARKEDSTRAPDVTQAAPPAPVAKAASTEPLATPSPLEEVAKKPQYPKYQKPKILLVDMPASCSQVLRNAGYNVAVGSFGTPYRVKASKRLMHVSIESALLPNYEEQEVIIVDTEGPEPVDKNIADAPAESVDAVWQSCKAGVIDPRPYVMETVRRAFERIGNHGGIFVVFVSAKEQLEYLYGHLDRYSDFQQRERFTLTNWSFLGALESLDASPACGQEVTFDPHGGDLTRP